jgi:hypothetical protein
MNSDMELDSRTTLGTSYHPYYTELADWIRDGGLWIEVGVMHGVGLIHAALQCRAQGKHAVRFLGVDRLSFDGHPQAPHEWAGILLRNLTLNHLHPSPVSLFLGDSGDAADLLMLFAADVVFIDGSHDYQSVKRDIALWRTRVRPAGGRLCGHDYDDNWPGVKQAVDEAFGSRVRVKHVNVWEVDL